MPWSYRDGTAGTPGNQAVTLEAPYRANSPSPAIAVLTGEWTASSGEAIVVAFRGRPNSRSFGVATAGASTANQTYPLGDGAFLFLTVADFADRKGVLYGGPIEPDQVVGAMADGEDPTLAEATSWLATTADCLEPAG